MQKEKLSVLDGLKKYGVGSLFELEALVNLEPAKLDIISIMGKTTDETMIHKLRELSKTAEMFDDTTPNKHIFQDLTNMPVSAGKWMLKGMLKENEYSLFFGQPGSRKSFILLDMALHLSNGKNWGGMKTKVAPTVLYLVGEGQGGINLRLKAAAQRHELPYNKILVSKLPGALMDEESVFLISKAIEAIDGPVWLIIDTLHRNMGDGDENTSKDFGVILQNLDNNIKSLGATVTIVHHTGHSNQDRSRGSSAIRGALDSEFLIEKDGNISKVICKKMKDAEFSNTLSFKANVELLGKDEDGDPITSLSMTPIDVKIPLQLNDTETEILKLLLTKPLSKTELKKEMKSSHSEVARTTINSRVDKALDELRIKGLVYDDSGHWTVSNEDDESLTMVEFRQLRKSGKSSVDEGDDTPKGVVTSSTSIRDKLDKGEKVVFVFDHEAAMRSDTLIRKMIEEETDTHYEPDDRRGWYSPGELNDEEI